MAIKLIVSDLDGTLLNSKKLISSANITAFQLAKEQKINVSIATGRMHLAAAFFGKQIGAQVPVISCNGAMIRDPHTDEAIFEEYIDDKISFAIIDYLIKNNIYCNWYIDTKRFAPYFSWDMFQGYRTVKGFNLTEVGDNYGAYCKNITQIVLRSCGNHLPEDIVSYLQKNFSDYIKMQQNTGCTIDVTPPDIDKGVGLMHLAAHLNISQDEILAFGDGDNDVAMLKYAGTSVAMSNAIDEVKNAASFVTDSCDNDGIAKAINKLLA